MHYKRLKIFSLCKSELYQAIWVIAYTNKIRPKPKKEPSKSTKKIDVLQEFAKRSEEKPSISLVIVGHVDAGKSTLMGHLLYLLGEVDEKVIRKYERESQKIGKGSFKFAWVLDATGEERER